MGEEHIKRMTDLLKSGATMLSEHCPSCNSPLFNIKGEIRCPKCNKRVVMISEERQLLSGSSLLDDAERIILLKIRESSDKILKEKQIAKLDRLSGLLIKWLEALEKIRRIKNL